MKFECGGSDSIHFDFWWKIRTKQRIMKKINPGKIYTHINISEPIGGPSLKAYYHQKCLVVILEDFMTEILLNSSTVLLISTHQSYKSELFSISSQIFKCYNFFKRFLGTILCCLMTWNIIITINFKTFLIS